MTALKEQLFEMLKGASDSDLARELEDYAIKNKYPYAGQDMTDHMLEAMKGQKYYVMKHVGSDLTFFFHEKDDRVLKFKIYTAKDGTRNHEVMYEMKYILSGDCVLITADEKALEKAIRAYPKLFKRFGIKMPNAFLKRLGVVKE